MHKRAFMMSIALVLLLTGASNSAENKTRPYQCTGSGTFADGVETNIDTNNDGLSGGLYQDLQNCNIGRLFPQEEIEFTAPLTPHTICPQGTDEYRLVQGQTVITDEKTSDQLFGKYDTDTVCVNPDGTFDFTTHITFTGGTGHFTGASGAADGRGTGKYLAFGFKNNVFGGFGQYSFTSVGTLTLPNGGHDNGGHGKGD
jgi:hypothetical protein